MTECVYSEPGIDNGFSGYVNRKCCTVIRKHAFWYRIHSIAAQQLHAELTKLQSIHNGKASIKCNDMTQNTQNQN